MKSTKRPLAAAAVALLTVACTQPKPLWQDSKAPLEKRVDALFLALTDDEKVDLLNGGGWMETHGNKRLGIPPLRMADGPMGVHSWSSPADPDTPATPKSIPATAFPAGVAMAATWNPQLVEEEGRTIAQEALALGRDQILGPTVNIARTPLWGRNFEGYGEDPFLASRMAVSYIRGMQGEGVIATVKHFAANNQETRRATLDVRVDERTLNEIYLPAFKAAVEEAGVFSVMSSYNKINGDWASRNPILLTDILKKKWGFRGFVVSDWASTHSTASTVNAGLDLEMPGAATLPSLFELIGKLPGGNPGYDSGYLAASKVKPLVASGEISKAAIDDSARRILRAMLAMGIFDRQRPDLSGPPPNVDTPGRRAIAQAAATEGAVLLKNEGAILPLDAGKLRSIAVLGPNAAANRSGGGGSSLVSPPAQSNPLEAIRRRAGSGVEVAYAAELKEAVDLARRSTVAIVFVGTNADTESEMFDRPSMDLPAGQDELIAAVAAANPRTIVVLNSGCPVNVTRWLARTPALLDAWFPGEAGGDAIASLLFGDSNPSGKLPVTFPKDLKDTPAYGHYPGTNDSVEYAEGIYVGYRHYDKRNIEPQFPFGHGLSYTKFEYRDLAVLPKSPRYGQVVQVTLKVKNAGPRAGAEVVQLYLHQVKSAVDRPPKELKAFRRVELKPGEEQTVTLQLDRASMSFFDPAAKDWATEPGEFEVLVGASSRDIRLKTAFELFE